MLYVHLLRDLPNGIPKVFDTEMFGRIVLFASNNENSLTENCCFLNNKPVQVECTDNTYFSKIKRYKNFKNVAYILNRQFVAIYS